MNRDAAKRVMRACVCPAWLIFSAILVVGCERAPTAKVVKGEQKELEPRVIVPSAEDVVSIRFQADEGFLGGPLDETIADAAAIDAIMKFVRVIQTGPRQVGDVQKFPKKGQLTINTKTSGPLELKLSDGRAVHFVSAYSINTEGIAEIVQQHRKMKK